MLKHGGNVRMAAQQYGIPLDNWLDLSTGINPQGWPIPEIAPAIWQRLPEHNDDLPAAMSAFYGSPFLLPTAGSQPVIQLLPTLRPKCRVGVLTPSYAEHAYAWERKGHQLIQLHATNIEEMLPILDVLIVCNPNNPDGLRFSPEQLLTWSNALTQRNGWLIVDEAFADATPEISIAAHSGHTGLVILRSLGKFFGLAGIRVGAVLAWPELLHHIEDELGPWTLNSPARYVATQALQDTPWQNTTRHRLNTDSIRLQALLSIHGFPPTGASALFQWVLHPNAHRLHHALAKQGVWTRHFDEPNSIRFGLPGLPQEWLRLEAVLSRMAPQLKAT